MMMIGKLLRFGRRQLHTIISREIIKPSSPTPSHLRTYNLSELDQLFKPVYVPLIFSYPNNGDCSLTPHEKATVLKSSLSLSLTHYHPFAGRFHKPIKPSYVDCNDEGVVFVEANHDCPMTTIQRMSELDEKLDHFFAEDLFGKNSSNSTNVVGVKLNHFSCGGVAVAVSMSHLIGDGFTFTSFVRHWASVARFGSVNHENVVPLNPHFIHSPRTDSIMPESQQVINANWVFRRFIFPNSKLSELKKKVTEINNPTRVEVLTSLLYKTAVAAATTKSGHFQPCFFISPVNIRNRFVEKLPQTTVGNLLSGVMIPTKHPSETSLSFLVSELKKQKLALEGIQSVQDAAPKVRSLVSEFGNEIKRPYVCTSLCGFPIYKVDFGWGKPVCASLLQEGVDETTIQFMDTPNGDGIEATVIMEKEEMEIFENDKEMLSFCDIN